MIKLRFSLLMALLMVVMSVWADNAPAKAQAALKKCIPKLMVSPGHRTAITIVPIS